MSPYYPAHFTDEVGEGKQAFIEHLLWASYFHLSYLLIDKASEAVGKEIDPLLPIKKQVQRNNIPALRIRKLRPLGGGSNAQDLTSKCEALIWV